MSRMSSRKVFSQELAFATAYVEFYMAWDTDRCGQAGMRQYLGLGRLLLYSGSFRP